MQFWPRIGQRAGSRTWPTASPARPLASAEAAYADEVRRLLDAALEVMRRCGTTSRPRVADIVAAAGLSNDAFYRHFPSKDALVAALLDDGAERLRATSTTRWRRSRRPEGQVRRWVEGVLSQARRGHRGDHPRGALERRQRRRGPRVRSPPRQRAARRAPARAVRGARQPRPELDASLAAHATLGRLTDHLWQRDQPTPRRSTASSTSGSPPRTHAASRRHTRALRPRSFRRLSFFLDGFLRLFFGASSSWTASCPSSWSASPRRAERSRSRASSPARSSAPTASATSTTGITSNSNHGENLAALSRSPAAAVRLDHREAAGAVGPHDELVEDLIVGRQPPPEAGE